MADTLFTPEQERRIREIVREEILVEYLQFTPENFHDMVKRAAYDAFSELLRRGAKISEEVK